MAHTPGPWSVGDEDRNGQVLVEGPQFSICKCHHHCVGTIELEMRDNAHLIAAAPDLLAACKALMETHHGYHLGVGPCICHAHEAAKAAIAKAEGR
jgi:hypothetical protein